MGDFFKIRYHIFFKIRWTIERWTREPTTALRVSLVHAKIKKLAEIGNRKKA